MNCSNQIQVQFTRRELEDVSHCMLMRSTEALLADNMISHDRYSAIYDSLSAILNTLRAAEIQHVQ